MYFGGLQYILMKVAIWRVLKKTYFRCAKKSQIRFRNSFRFWLRHKSVEKLLYSLNLQHVLRLRRFCAKPNGVVYHYPRNQSLAHSEMQSKNWKRTSIFFLFVRYLTKFQVIENLRAIRCRKAEYNEKDKIIFNSCTVEKDENRFKSSILNIFE